MISRKLNPAFYNVQRSKDWIGNVDIAFDPSADDVNVSLDIPDTLTPQAAALILSDRSTTQWRRSTAFLVSDYDFTASADDVWQSYSDQAAQLVSNWYLNQADNNTAESGNPTVTAEIRNASFESETDTLEVEGRSNTPGASLAIKVSYNLSAGTEDAGLYLPVWANAVVANNGNYGADITNIYADAPVLSWTTEVYFNGKLLASMVTPKP